MMGEGADKGMFIAPAPGKRREERRKGIGRLPKHSAFIYAYLFSLRPVVMFVYPGKRRTPKDQRKEKREKKRNVARLRQAIGTAFGQIWLGFARCGLRGRRGRGKGRKREGGGGEERKTGGKKGGMKKRKGGRQGGGKRVLK